MAHFAQVDENNVVVQVLVVSDEQQDRGQDFLANDLGLGGNWIQCSYNNKIRKQYPGAGYTYDPNADVFIKPKPFESWTLNENYDWIAPIPYPNDGNFYRWDEKQINWTLID